MHNRATGDPIVCQNHTTVKPLEQHCAQIRLQLSNLLADSGLGDMQLVPRQGKTSVPGSGFEYAQAVQVGTSRGQAFSDNFYLS